jgi:hypothetical protein
VPHGETSLTRLEVVTRGRGLFGFAQGRLFDFAETSLREVPAPLRMTICGESCRAALGLDGRGARLSTGRAADAASRVSTEN